METRITPALITELKINEIFVFGSNCRGEHAGGAARAAYEKFGAIWGRANGLQGQSYGIDTMSGIPVIELNALRLIEFAKRNRDLILYVTPIGCGIAGYKAEDIAPLFKEAVELPNVFLPKEFWYVLTEKYN